MLHAATLSSLRQGLHEWLAIALAELRSLRRQARTWVFLGLGIAVMGTTYTYYSYLHASWTTFATLNGNTLPRFTTAYFNSYVLWFFMAALVFLAFDLRRRDERDRVAAVLDSRPFSNTALLGGRLCAVVLAIALPLFAMLLLIQGAGTVGRAFGKWVDPIEPVATFTFYFLDAIPALTLWCAVVLVLAAGLRNRLATAVAALALIGLHMWSFALVPGYLLPAVSLLYIHDNWASDLAPRLPDAQTFLHRASMLVLAAALVVLAAALHKRPDGGSRSRRVALGTVLGAISATGMGTVAVHCIDGVHLRDSWLAAHTAAAGEPLPIVEHMDAVIEIDPGTRLRLEIDMEISAAATDLPRFLFSFNPGLETTELLLDDEPTSFRHEQGLLIVEPPEPLPRDGRAVLTVRASGIPDSDFAYLDSAVDWRRESSRNSILWLGTAGGIFEKRYVALMPGLRWLPVPGPNLDDAARAHSPTVDLTVRLPDGWLVAGPGRRQDLGGGRFRFQPKAGVPKVGLLAARFERRALEVAGVELELLLHPAHLRNLNYYDGAHELIRSRLEEIFDGAAGFGIPYPYSGFTVVEVPAHLRGYGGGHWLDTQMILPGLLLLKEHGFPYANLWIGDPNQVPNLNSLKVQQLEMAFAIPYSSGSALRGLARNLVTFQTTAVGSGARALDFVGEELARELFSNPASFRYSGSTMFTAHTWNADVVFGATAVQMIGDLANRGTGQPGFTQFAFAQPSVWERAMRASLAEMDLDHDPSKAISAFAMRGNAVARSIVDGLGRNRTAALLGELRRRSSDGTYNASDFVRAGSATGGDIEQLIGDWLTDVALPGFVVSRALVERVADYADGKPRYEIRVHVRNDEPTPGLVRLSLGIMPQSARSEPVRIEGKTTVEVGMVTAEPPQALWLEPYLALNRAPFRIDLDIADEHQTAAREPFVGTRSSTWTPPPAEGIVIDDLDPGFSTVMRHEDARIGGVAASAFPREFDQGLPTWTSTPGEWSRATIPTSWGKYRHTTAGALAGDGDQVAVFVAHLPRSGRWQLDYYVPNRQALGPAFFPSFGASGRST